MRKKTIKHADKVFAPVPQSNDLTKQLAMAAPLIGFMLVIYVWIVVDIITAII